MYTNVLRKKHFGLLVRQLSETKRKGGVPFLFEKQKPPRACKLPRTAEARGGVKPNIKTKKKTTGKTKLQKKKKEKPRACSLPQYGKKERSCRPLPKTLKRQCQPPSICELQGHYIYTYSRGLTGEEL